MMRVMTGLLTLLLTVATGCAGSGPVHSDGPLGGYDVIFSLANQDRRAPIAVMDIVVDGTIVFHGMIPSTSSGEYQYIHTRFSGQKIDLEIRSEVEGGTISASKKVYVKDHLWVIVTRLRELDGEPEIQIDLSYEETQFVPEGK